MCSIAGYDTRLNDATLNEAEIRMSRSRRQRHTARRAPNRPMPEKHHRTIALAKPVGGGCALVTHPKRVRHILI